LFVTAANRIAQIAIDRIRVIVQQFSALASVIPMSCYAGLQMGSEGAEICRNFQGNDAGLPSLKDFSPLRNRDQVIRGACGPLSSAI
jgi:hypothetical protein